MISSALAGRPGCVRAAVAAASPVTRNSRRVSVIDVRVENTERAGAHKEIQLCVLAHPLCRLGLPGPAEAGRHVSLRRQGNPVNDRSLTATANVVIMTTWLDVRPLVLVN